VKLAARCCGTLTNLEATGKILPGLETIVKILTSEELYGSLSLELIDEPGPSRTRDLHRVAHHAPKEIVRPGLC
jgi:hypothetical protein